MYSSKKDYTLLNKDINKMNSKYVMNIYQIIKIKQKQINPHTNKRLIEISYNLKELNEIFNTSHKFISKFKHHFEDRKKSIVSKSSFVKSA